MRHRQKFRRRMTARLLQPAAKRSPPPAAGAAAAASPPSPPVDPRCASIIADRRRNRRGRRRNHPVAAVRGAPDDVRVWALHSSDEDASCRPAYSCTDSRADCAANGAGRRKQQEAAPSRSASPTRGRSRRPGCSSAVEPFDFERRKLQFNSAGTNYRPSASEDVHRPSYISFGSDADSCMRTMARQLDHVPDRRRPRRRPRRRAADNQNGMRQDSLVAVPNGCPEYATTWYALGTDYGV